MGCVIKSAIVRSTFDCGKKFCLCKLPQLDIDASREPIGYTIKQSWALVVFFGFFLIEPPIFNKNLFSETYF